MAITLTMFSKIFREFVKNEVKLNPVLEVCFKAVENSSKATRCVPHLANYIIDLTFKSIVPDRNKGARIVQGSEHPLNSCFLLGTSPLYMNSSGRLQR